MPSTGVPSSPTQRIIEAAAVVQPGAALGGWAAAYACGADLLDGLDDFTMAPLPVLVCRRAAIVCLSPGSTTSSTDSPRTR